MLQTKQKVQIDLSTSVWAKYTGGVREKYNQQLAELVCVCVEGGVLQDEGVWISQHKIPSIFICWFLIWGLPF